MKRAVYALCLWKGESERKGGGEPASIKQLDLLRALVKPSGPNQNGEEGEV